MLFNSIEYVFFFLPASLAVYFVLAGRADAVYSRAWLAAASLFFYAWWKVEYLALILLSIAVNYLLAGRILRLAGTPGARTALIAGIVFDVGLLGVFKYTGFVVDNVNWLLGVPVWGVELVLPLAISFFTFQQIAYLCDCYREPARHYAFLDYVLFVSFFPQLIAGPIVHHREMMPQYLDPARRRFVAGNVACGLFIFGLGLFKKLVVADTFAGWADAGFDGSGELTLFPAWAAALSYTFQLYYDFSGYADMAIGAALMFNFRLPVNFDSPYRALDIQDFWRRWHMTLSRWLKEYVYIPLGGNRAGEPRLYANLLLTFVIGGLWHGAGWTFVLWGALHGVAVVVHRLWRRLGLRLPAAAAWLLTFLFVVFAWVFFRAESLPAALRVLQGMLGLNGAVLAPGFLAEATPLWAYASDLVAITRDGVMNDFQRLQFLVLFAAIAFFAPNSMRLSGYVEGGPWRRSFRPRWNWLGGHALVMGFALVFLFTNERVEFLYFNF